MTDQEFYKEYLALQEDKRQHKTETSYATGMGVLMDILSVATLGIVAPHGTGHGSFSSWFLDGQTEGEKSARKRVERMEKAYNQRVENTQAANYVVDNYASDLYRRD